MSYSPERESRDQVGPHAGDEQRPLPRRSRFSRPRRAGWSENRWTGIGVLCLSVAGVGLGFFLASNGAEQLGGSMAGVCLPGVLAGLALAWRG